VVLLDASVSMRPHLHVALQSVASLLHRKAELLSPPSPSYSKSVCWIYCAGSYTEHPWRGSPLAVAHAPRF